MTSNRKITDHIAIFLPTMYVGGAEKVMLTLAKGFSERGFSVDLVLAKAEGPYLSQLPSNVRVIDLKASRVLFSIVGLIKYLKKEKPSALLSALDHCNVIALLGKIFSKVNVRTVIGIHSNFTNNTLFSSSIITRLTPFWVRPFYSKADAIVAVSNGVADDLCKSINLQKNKVTVIYNPIVSQELFDFSIHSPEHPWLCEGQPPVILGVGRLTAAKNFPELIRAFARVRSIRSVRLIILGDGEERSSLENLVHSLSLENDVKFLGFVENPYAYMKAARIFVSSSRWEGFGNVLAEAMACGARIISSDCPSGPAEILEYGRWGQLVPVDDTIALSDAILSQLDSDVRIGIVESAMDRFGVEQIVDQYLNVSLP